jgi:hypothetical protein
MLRCKYFYPQQRQNTIDPERNTPNMCHSLILDISDLVSVHWKILHHPFDVVLVQLLVLVRLLKRRWKGWSTVSGDGGKQMKTAFIHLRVLLVLVVLKIISS